MNPIHIATGNGQTAQYAEAQVRDMLAEGRLDENTLCWREGMPDWRAVGTVLGPYAPPALSPTDPTEEDAGGGYRFTRDPLRLTRVLKMMLGLQFLLVVGIVVGERLARPDRVPDEYAGG